MCSSEEAILSFAKFRSSWNFCAIPTDGLSGGIMSGWNPPTMNFKAYKTCVGIFMECFFRDFNFLISCINCYEPYHNKEVFWNRVESIWFLNYPNLIMASDLNFTLS